MASKQEKEIMSKYPVEQLQALLGHPQKGNQSITNHERLARMYLEKKKTEEKEKLDQKIEDISNSNSNISATALRAAVGRGSYSKQLATANRIGRMLGGPNNQQIQLPSDHIHYYFNSFIQHLSSNERATIKNSAFRKLQIAAMNQQIDLIKNATDKHLNRNKNNQLSYDAKSLFSEFLDSGSTDKMFNRIHQEASNVLVTAGAEIKSLGVSYQSVVNSGLTITNKNDFLLTLNEMLGKATKVANDVVKYINDYFYDGFSSQLYNLLRNSFVKTRKNNTSFDSYVERIAKQNISEYRQGDTISIPNDFLEDKSLEEVSRYLLKLKATIHSLQQLSVQIQGKSNIDTKDVGLLKEYVNSLSVTYSGAGGWLGEYATFVGLESAEADFLPTVVGDVVLTGSMNSNNVGEDIGVSFRSDSNLNSRLNETKNFLKHEFGNKQLKNDVTMVVRKNGVVLDFGFSCKQSESNLTEIKPGIFMPGSVNITSVKLLDILKKSKEFGQGFSDYKAYNLASNIPHEELKTGIREIDAYAMNGNKLEKINKLWKNYAIAMTCTNLMKYTYGNGMYGHNSIFIVVNGRLYSMYEVFFAILKTLESNTMDDSNPIILNNLPDFRGINKKIGKVEDNYDDSIDRGQGIKLAILAAKTEIKLHINFALIASSLPRI